MSAGWTDGCYPTSDERWADDALGGEGGSSGGGLQGGDGSGGGYDGGDGSNGGMSDLWPTPDPDPRWSDVYAALAAEARDRARRVARMIRLIARPR